MAYFSRRGCLCLALGLLWANAAPAEHEHSSSGLQIFVAADAFHGSGHQPRDEADPSFNADFVAGLTRHRFRILGELYVTRKEADLERFQVGWEFAPETVLWLGRFHQPGSAWNTEHHHGQYLQTDIMRPYIERWEDEQGIIPEHIAGALLESRQSIGTAGAIQVDAGVGAAPKLIDSGISPFILTERNSGRHGLSVTGRVGYLPEYVGTNSIGLLFGRDVLDTPYGRSLTSVAVRRAELQIYGGYIDWTAGPWRAVGANYYVDVTLGSALRRESFISAYLQIERQLPHNLTAFGRTENASRMQESRYVALFDRDRQLEIALRRQALGVRWDFIRREALTLELSHIVSLHQSSNEVRLQWSATFP